MQTKIKADFDNVSKIHLGDMNVSCFEYKHKSGLNVVYISDKKYKDIIDVNITMRTPAFNNAGVTHIIEHCIQSEIFMKKFLKQNAYTFQDKTSYEYSIYKNDIQNLRNILNEIFFPKIKTDKNIFLREAWRVDSNNNNISIGGIVFNEIKKASTSPLHNIIRYIPYTLYKDVDCGKISGGTIEDILDLNLNDLIEYHNRIYVPSNCCIFIHGFNCIDELLEIINDVLEDYLSKSLKNEKYKFEDNLKLKPNKKPFEISYRSFKQDKNRCFISINFLVNKPKNQFEYNVYYTLNYLLVNECNGILNKKIKNNKLGKKVEAAFKNSLYYPYFTVILGYCEKDVVKEFCDILKNSFYEVINSLDFNNIPNYINLDFNNRGNVDGLIMAKYIMEAIYSDINVFSYIQNNISDEKKEEFRNTLLRTFVYNPDYSIILESPVIVQNEKNDKELINKALKNGIVNEYNSNFNKKLSQSTHYLLDASDNINNYFESPKIIMPDISEIGTIKAYLYNRSDSNVNVHFYFDISNFDFEQICYVDILSKFLNRCFYTESNHSIVAFGYPINNSKATFILKIHADMNNIDEIFKSINNLLNSNSIENSEEMIKNIISEVKSDFDMNIVNRTTSFLNDRILSYFSNLGLYKDALGGIGSYKFFCENSDESLMYKISDIRKLVFNKENVFVSIYAKDKEKVVKSMEKFINGLNTVKMPEIKNTKFNIKNEGFILNLDNNYIAQGFNLDTELYKDLEKYSIICNIVTDNYLFTTLRNKYNAYSCRLLESSGNILFLSIQDPNIETTLEVFRNTSKYILNNTKKIMNEYELYKRNYILNYKDPIITPENDRNTIKILFPNVYKFKNEVISDLNRITEEDIIKFYELIKKIIDKNCYCVIGNEYKIKKNDKLFNSIEYLI